MTLGVLRIVQYSLVVDDVWTICKYSCIFLCTIDPRTVAFAWLLEPLCKIPPFFLAFFQKTRTMTMLFYNRKRAFKGTGSPSKTAPLMRFDDHIPFIHFTPPLPARNGFGTSAFFIGPLNFLLYPLVLSYICHKCCCLLLVVYLVYILHLSCTSLS